MTVNNQQSQSVQVEGSLQTSNANPAAKVSLTQQAALYGADKVTKSKWQSFGLAIFAGAFIALISVVFFLFMAGNYRKTEKLEGI